MRVHAIQTGSVSVTERQREGRGPGPLRPLGTMLDRDWTEPLPIYAWAIEHPEGVIVVDTGEPARTAERGWFPRWHPYFKMAVRLQVEPEDEIGPALGRLGIATGDVRWVVLTHLHTDHAGGLEHFPRSEIVVTRTEYAAARGTLGKLRGYLPHRWPAWFAPRLLDLPQEPFGPFPESVPLTSDGKVRIVATPGHTAGHVSVVLEEDGAAVMFAGDASYTEDLMLRGAIDGVAPDPRAARSTLERILAFTRERPAVYLPSHDPDAGERLERRATS